MIDRTPTWLLVALLATTTACVYWLSRMGGAEVVMAGIARTLGVPWVVQP